MNHFYSGCPVAKRTNETFVQFVDVGGKRERIEFAREIVWLLESESVMRYLHGGREVKHGSTYNDFYGFLTSYQGQRAEIETAAAHYGITPDSSLELVIETMIRLVPAFESEEAARYNKTKPENYKAQWMSVPSDWRRERPDPRGGAYYPSLESVVIGQRAVWSSKATPAGNEVTFNEFAELWKRGYPVVNDMVQRYLFAKAEGASTGDLEFILARAGVNVNVEQLEEAEHGWI